ncbi:MAG: glucose-6-phosphate isomerase [Planctomycetota bacterium]
MISIDFNNILYGVIGPGHSISEPELTKAITENAGICQEVQDERENGKHFFLDLPYQNVADIISLADKKAKSYENFVVLGIGGSALGTITLQQALTPPFYNLLSAKERNGFPRLFVLDNIDSSEIQALFKLVNPKKTLFNVISKSGETTETIASLLIVLKVLKQKLGKKYQQNLIVTTDRDAGFMRRLVNKESYLSFETPKNIEGRYAVLSPVGLVPAAFLGIDIKKLLYGASVLDKYIQRVPVDKNPAYISALINFIYDRQKSKNIMVIMPYAAQLKAFAEWLRQLYPESLGKRYDLNNKEVYVGPTVINALGVTDQHSQIQLYNEGPNNKLIIFVEVENHKDKIVIPNLFRNDESASFLAGHSLQELMLAEKKGTEYSLIQNRRPNYTIRLKNISEETIGALLYFWELTTAYAGKLYKVNPYNQPGVEAGKRATFGLMGRKGFDKEVPEIADTLTKDKRWIIGF